MSQSLVFGFGVQFIPIYKRHPQANMYAICRRSKAALNAVGDAFRGRSDATNDTMICFSGQGRRSGAHQLAREASRARSLARLRASSGNFSLGSPDNG